MEQSAERFWAWFDENSSSYSFINQVSPEVKERLLSSFTAELHKYCDKLYFEIGGDSEKCQEVIITAEGNRDYFSHVENLVNAAPEIRDWTVIAFIPPRDIHFKMDYEGLHLSPEEMWFMPLENEESPDDIGVKIFLKNYELVADHDFFDSAMNKILDVLLGEKAAALDIQYVAFDQLSDDPDEDCLIELSELANYISWRKTSA